MKQRTIYARALALLLAAMVAGPISLMAQSAPQLPDPGNVRGVTKDQQEQIGLQAMGEVYKQMPVLPDSSPVTQYVNQLGQRLATVIPRENSWPYQFHVIPQKEINAFALPGGPIFVNLGTIEAAANEAELAGVIAHEMSHVYMQHSIKQAEKGQTLQGLAAILGAVLPGNAAGNIGRAGIQLGAGTLSLKYSRGDEAQADAVGAIIAYRAGYNPKAMADFFQKLEQEAGPGGPQFLSDHPNPGNRQEAVSKEIQGWPAESYRTSSNSFTQAKQAASGVKSFSAQEIQAGAKSGQWAQQNERSGSMPRNLPAPSGKGNKENSGPGGGSGGDISSISLREVRPSSRFTQFQQGDFSISYPDNWQAANGQGGALIAPQAGVAQGAIAYGVMIGEGQDQNAQSLDQATQDLIRSLQQQNPRMRTSGDMNNISVNGMRGRSIYLSGPSPVQKDGQPLTERDWLVTLPRSQGGLLYLVFISPESDFNSLRSTYQKMLDSLELR
jgi:Zn-dependent protease with chaperone function